MNSSGGISSAIPGSISTQSTSTTITYNGWPVRQTIPIYRVYSPEVVQGNSSLSNQPCVAVQESGPIYSYWEAYQLQRSAISQWESLSVSYPPCKYKIGVSSQTTHISPSRIVNTFWQDVATNRLPHPSFSVPPGFALTGMQMYLDATCTLNKTFSDPTPIGTATIVASGELWVEWNSGQGWYGPYQNCGGPWPSGTITHTFHKKGVSIVSVKETWTASWNLAGAQGTLSELYTLAPSLYLPVRSVTSEVYT